MRLILLIHALLISVPGCADHYLLFPSTRAIDARSAQRIVIEPSTEVWMARSPAAQVANDVEAYVLEFTGNATRAEEIATYAAGRWQPHRAEVWVMNYPGFGGSAGPAKLHSIAPAALATFDELKRHAGEKPIFVCGNSLGGAVALCVAARRPVAGMIVQNPPAIRQIILGEHGWWNLWLLAGTVALGVPGELDAIANAPNIHARVVFITADADTLVPPKYQDRIAARLAGPVGRIHLKNAGHWHTVDQLQQTQLLTEAINWLITGESPDMSTVITMPAPRPSAR
jgi:pimeloyl-ACP methyl ester carboxylesterase